MQNSLELNYFHLIDIGRKKKNNEDYVTCLVPEKGQDTAASGSLFVLADGVGGASLGEVASKYAADLVLHEYYKNSSMPPAERLVQSFKKASRDIHQHAEENGHYTKMATTMVAAAVYNNKLIVANVGDSRAYLIRDGQALQITKDHSVVAEMVRNGTMTKEEAQISSIRNRLSRSIGGEAKVTVDVFNPILLEIGDKILLCSDGLTRYASPDDLVKMTAEGTPEKAAQRLIRFANHQGGADNISVVLVEVVQTAAPRKADATEFDKAPRLANWQEADDFTGQGTSQEKKKLPVVAIGITTFFLLVVIISGTLLLKDTIKVGFSAIAAYFDKENSDHVDTATATSSTLETAAITETEPPKPTLTPTTPDIFEDSSGFTWNCWYQLPAGVNSVYDALRIFETEWIKESQYQGYESCTTNGNYIDECNTEITYQASHDPTEDWMIHEGEWIMVREIKPANSESAQGNGDNPTEEEIFKPQESCVDKGGFVEIIDYQPPTAQTDSESETEVETEEVVQSICTGTAKGNGINLRNEPDGVITASNLSTGEEVELLKMDETTKWLYVRSTTIPNHEGWVQAENIDHDPSCLIPSSE